MVKLAEVVDFLDRTLRTAEIGDYGGAYNGLQLENRGEVSRVAVAVDASEGTLREAVEAGADLLLVHHGLFWQSCQPVTGVAYRKLRLAIEGGLAVYASHLPLDVHPELGNNAGLLAALGWEATGTFLPSKGQEVGLVAEIEAPAAEVKAALERVLGGRVHHCPGGPETIRRVGVVTGGAGSEVAEAARCGLDALVTGEGPHWSYPLAEELGIHLFYGGHYATETFGVKALGALLEERFGLPWGFIDRPTGL